MSVNDHWLESLRPDPVTRERLRRAILAEAAPLLAMRERSYAATWWQVAAGWAPQLIPIAAACILVFAGIAMQAGPSGAPQEPPGADRLAATPRMEELLGQPDEAVLRSVLMQDTVRGLNPLLASSVYIEER